MTDKPTPDMPESGSGLIVELLSRALERCDRQGIAFEDFYRAMAKEQQLHPKASLEEFFERVFRRLEGMMN
jgi:hypothetical protein